MHDILFTPWTDSDRINWELWFSRTANDLARYSPTTLEMLAKMDDDISAGNTPIYELPARYTLSGRPELFSF